MNSKKRKERKQIITLVICAAVIVMLVVLYAVIKNGSGDGADTDTEFIPADIGTFEIIDENYSLITSLSYAHYGEEYNFHIEDGKWIMTDDPDFPLDQQVLVYMAQAISDYGGFRRLSYDENKDEAYGFTSPTYMISAEYYDSKGETTHTNNVVIGAKNELTGYYYFHVDGDKYTYMVNDSLFTYFDYTKSQLFATLDIPSPDITDVKSMTFTYGGIESSIDIPEKATEGDNPYTAAENILSTLFYDCKLKYNNCADFCASEEELAEYGLDDPYLKIDLAYTRYQEVATEDSASPAKIALDDRCVIIVGSETVLGDADEGGNVTDETPMRYITFEGESIVYIVKAEKISEILSYAGIEE